MIIPTGTAIQNARTSFVGDHMNRDGYHLRFENRTLYGPLVHGLRKYSSAMS